LRKDSGEVYYSDSIAELTMKGPSFALHGGREFQFSSYVLEIRSSTYSPVRTK